MNNFFHTFGCDTRPRQFVLAMAVIMFMAAVGVLYADSFRWLAGIWLNEKEYSHGFLVPFVSGYFIYLHRRQFAQCPINQSLASGLFVIFVAMLLLFMGRLGLVIQLEVLSFFIVLPGIIILFLGWYYLLLLLLPLGYLVFMLPVMDYLPGDIHVPLQHLAAAGGAKLMQLAGYAVYRDGLLLHLPGITIKVARVCSGVNLLFSVVAVGIPLVYLYQRSIRNALVVLAGGVLVAVAANSGRVALAGISAIHYGVDMLHGPHHVLQAFSVAVAGYIALFFVSYLVNRYFPGQRPLLYEQVAEKLLTLAKNRTKPGNVYCFTLPLLAIILLVCTFFLNGYFKPQAVPVRRPLTSLANRLGNWRSTDQANSLGEKFFPDVPLRLERKYVRGDGVEVSSFIGYFPRQDFDAHLFTYHAAGLRCRLVPVDFQSSCNGNPEQVNHGFISLDNGQQVEAVMWYRISGKTEFDPRITRIEYARSTLLHRRNNIAVILLMRKVQSGVDKGKISGGLKNFLSLFSCELHKYLP